MFRSKSALAFGGFMLAIASASASAQSTEQPKHIYQDPEAAKGGRLTEADKQKLLDAQRDAYVYHVETERALALKGWCETGLAPADLCHPAGQTAAVAAAPAAAVAQPAPVATPTPTPAPAPKQPERPEPVEARELPMVTGLTGFANNLTATVQYSNGSRLTIVAPHGTQPGSRLPSGENVVSITPKTIDSPPMVLIAKPGEEKTLRPLVFAPITEAR